MRARAACALAAAVLACTGTAALAQGLMGQAVSFQIRTYDDPGRPLFEGQVHGSVVTRGIEFGLGREGTQNDIDVVPVLVDIGPARIEISYAIADPGELWRARFNGYVIGFTGGCATVLDARVDAGFTNIPVDNKRVRAVDGGVRIDVSGLSYDRDSRIGIDLALSDCPSG